METKNLGSFTTSATSIVTATCTSFSTGTSLSYPRGPLKGCKWFYAANTSIWHPLGSYEAETINWLHASLPKGSEFFDVGANVGYVTLAGSVITGSNGKVYAFEPVPANLEIILKQISLNSISNIRVEEFALSDRSGEVEFIVEKNSANSHFGKIALAHAKTDQMSTIRVKTITLDEYVAKSKVNPALIKIDVEGAELDVLKGAACTLKSIRPIVLVATHSSGLKISCKALLEQLGYEVTNLPGFEHELICNPLR